MFEVIALPFMPRAAAALILSGVFFPSLGAVILALNLVAVRFAVMHVALLGGTIGLVLGLDPIAGGLVASAAAGTALARADNEVGTSGGLAVVMSLSLAASFILMHLARLRALDGMLLLWGSLLAVSWPEVAVLALLGLVLLALLARYRKEVQVLLFDPVYAASLGLPVRGLRTVLLGLLCVGLAAAMRLTGALLVDGITLLPAIAAKTVARSFVGLLTWGAVFGLAANLGGLALSLVFDLPPGPSVILVAAGIVGLARIVARGRRHGTHEPPSTTLRGEGRGPGESSS